MALYHVNNQLQLPNPAAPAGSTHNPFGTITQAVDRAQAGDEIVIHTGVYREEIKLVRSGTAKDKMTTIRAADGETPILKGSDIIQGWKPFAPHVWVSP